MRPASIFLIIQLSNSRVPSSIAVVFLDDTIKSKLIYFIYSHHKTRAKHGAKHEFQ